MAYTHLSCYRLTADYLVSAILCSYKAGFQMFVYQFVVCLWPTLWLSGSFPEPSHFCIESVCTCSKWLVVPAPLQSIILHTPITDKCHSRP